MIVDWEALADNFEQASADQESFLDLRTGSIVGWSSEMEGLVEVGELRRAVAAEPQRYARIEGPSPAVLKEWMEEFALKEGAGVEGALLLGALDGTRGLRSFRIGLQDLPELRDRWRALERRRVREAVRAWLAVLGLQPENPPPW
ncbi:MAG: hypothetical protein HY303_01380 [Candidatus Wallbacteria bacterium]|nr:hypothetical protein [Candidatus Wallbacteria bacterium]